MQRTNISRDVREDLELNRMYLPKTKRTFKGEKKKILNSKTLKSSISLDLKEFLNETDLYYLNSWEELRNFLSNIPYLLQLLDRIISKGLVLKY